MTHDTDQRYDINGDLRERGVAREDHLAPTDEEAADLLITDDGHSTYAAVDTEDAPADGEASVVPGPEDLVDDSGVVSDGKTAVDRQLAEGEGNVLAATMAQQAQVLGEPAEAGIAADNVRLLDDGHDRGDLSAPLLEPSRADILPEAPAIMPEAAPTWPEDVVHELRTRWHAAQLRFVDDPPAAATDAKNLLDEVVDSLTQRLGTLHAWDLTRSDTEQLRVVVANYRDLFDQLVPRA